VTISIDDLEHAAAPGWRAIEEDRLGDWLLRAAAGFTGRANSALAAGAPGRPLPEAIEAVCRWYAARSLPPTIAVPYPAGRPGDSVLDRLLADLGWTIRADAATVMTAEPARVAALAGDADVTVDFDSAPDAAWLARYHYRGQELPAAAIQLLTSAPWQAFASVRTDGDTIAIGRVAGSDSWAGLTAIEVAGQHRRKGLGRVVTGALASCAAARGATGLFLQVADDNHGARALYRQLGFADHHGYHYRIAPG
jgi:ribosomal protein S18 acetylase RimI-like enzyme